jgi:hypothetical protein
MAIAGPAYNAAGQNKDAGSDNATNTEKDELPGMQLSLKRSLSKARLAEFIDRSFSKDIHGSSCRATPRGSINTVLPRAF